MSEVGFFIKTFGCKVNQYESQLIRETLLLAGWHEVENIDLADVLIINGCAVTQRAEKKARHLALKKSTKVNVVLTGCAATALRWDDEIIKNGIKIIPQKDKCFLPSLIGSGAQSLLNRISFFKGHSRAFVKLQDGCGMHCSYCYIPYLRGRPYLRATSEIQQELVALAEAGYKEVVFTGICLGWGNQDIVSLARFAVRQLGIKRVRLSSIEPFFMEAGQLFTLIKEGLICEHLHIPFQSGSKKILLAMGRSYDPYRCLDVIEEMRKICPDLAISSDIMVGFPGETDIDFQQTLEFIRKLEPMRVHCFPYSRRPYTKAAEMPCQIPVKVKKERVSQVIDLANRLKLKYLEKFVGRKLEVLVESREADFWVGRTKNYIEVYFVADGRLENQIKDIRIKNVKDFGVYGEIAD